MDEIENSHQRNIVLRSILMRAEERATPSTGPVVQGLGGKDQDPTSQSADHLRETGALWTLGLASFSLIAALTVWG